MLAAHEKNIARAAGESLDRGYRLRDIAVLVADPDSPLRGLFEAAHGARFAEVEAEALRDAEARKVRPVLVLGVERWKASKLAAEVSQDLATRLESEPEREGDVWLLVHLDGYMFGRAVAYYRLSGSQIGNA